MTQADVSIELCLLCFYSILFQPQRARTHTHSQTQTLRPAAVLSEGMHLIHLCHLRNHF